jgi:hypothetical protein
MELQDIRNRWNEVLDAVLEVDRVSWIAFFDARKLSSSHEFSETRLKQQQILIAAINSVLAIDVEISER